jgi:3',5'-cyclic AMP phosphodiesterase CpdA
VGGSYFGEVLSYVSDKADFIVHTGDVVENSKHESDWESMLDDNFDGLSSIPMMAISGNHETTYKNGSNETYKHFNNKLPEQDSTNLGYFYSFVYGNTKFIMLNTNELSGSSYLKDDQYYWLIDELENNDCTWTVVAMHNPMYSVGKYGSDPSRNSICLSLRLQLQGLFYDYGVDLVLQGHDHAISRTYPINGEGYVIEEEWTTVDGTRYSVDPTGVIYLMNGPAGPQSRAPYDSYDASKYEYAQTSHSRSWAEITVEDNVLTVTVRYYNGVYQTWGIIKNQ